MSRTGKMILGLFMAQAGHHEAAWRYSTAHTDTGINIDRYISYAECAESAAFHFLFVADTAGVRETQIDSLSAVGRTDVLEPLTTLAALSMRTEHIGLVATASTTFNDPYHLARKFASIDHISRGRAGWNIVTSSNPNEAHNFGHSALPDHDNRYHKADEFLEIAKKLWDSWQDDAFVRDKERGVYFEKDRLHIANHEGRYYKVRGPLNAARCPQGYPVLAQAGSSEVGMEFAARHGELIFSAQQTVEGAKSFYRSLKAAACKAGRGPDSIVVLPGLVPIVGKTMSDARMMLNSLQDYVQHAPAIDNANRLLGHAVDLSRFRLDDLVPQELPVTNLMQSRQKLILAHACRHGLTIGQLISLLSIGRGHYVCIGSPEDIVDEMQEFYTEFAADGFIIMPPIFPDGLQRFADLVVPVLQRRGLFRQRYEGATLRENLHLKRPPNQYL
ncbi:LLM class flavin-dependent oxidoreductase [Agrobacterium leguminum]|uniref:LLM class flavin-dependent oxidoreductase n=1 Tax=Agrobacterium TaxID=357 RepID=UPI0009B99D71|nr:MULTISPECIES: LLM class flavin-dependent oxidoreductase [Agrobacterium]WFS69321.1 LLM class flavin-dependent oxidoreductase [Agrobacterium leguminum]